MLAFLGGKVLQLNKKSRCLQCLGILSRVRKVELQLLSRKQVMFRHVHAGLLSCLASVYKQRLETKRPGNIHFYTKPLSL